MVVRHDEARRLGFRREANECVGGGVGAPTLRRGNDDHPLSTPDSVEQDRHHRRCRRSPQGREAGDYITWVSDQCWLIGVRLVPTRYLRDGKNPIDLVVGEVHETQTGPVELEQLRQRHSAWDCTAEDAFEQLLIGGMSQHDPEGRRLRPKWESLGC